MEIAMPEANERAKDIESGSQTRATVERRVEKPAGLLPKNTQQLVILGVAVVMVLIMWLTGNSKRPTTATISTPSPRVQPLDPATVQEFKQSIQKDQAATRQPISQDDLRRLEALGLADRVPPGAVVPPDGTPPPTPMPMATMSGNQSPPPDPVKEDKRKREYLALFAPNVAFTYRRGQAPEQLVGPQGRALTASAPTATNEPLTLNLEELEQQVPPLGVQLSTTNHPTAEANRDLQRNEHETRGELKAAYGLAPNPREPQSGLFSLSAYNPYVLFEGTVLEAVLINRLNGTFSGPVNCLMTNDIYSHDGQHVLIPAGTKILGETKKVETFGQQRLAVFFHRLIMPDGFSVTLDQFKSLNQIGETSLQGKVNNHYVQIFGASLAIGVLGGLAQAGTGNAYTNSPSDQARVGFGASLANSSMQILDKFLNVLPTVTVREGTRIKVYLAGDLLLPDYSQHTGQLDTSGLTQMKTTLSMGDSRK
jgi:type IV secretory pathway VirB10-like protein